MLADRRRYKAEVWDIMQLIFGRFNNHQLHCVIRLANHLDVDRLRRAVDLSAEVFPLITCRFVDSASRPYWEETGLTADDVVRVEEGEVPDEAVPASLLTRIDESVGPQLRISVIRGLAADSLCVIMNHMVCDAAGLKEYLYLLSSIYGRLGDTSIYRPDYAMGSRSCRQVLCALDWVDRTRVLLDRYQLSKHRSGVVFELDGDAGNPFIETHTLSRQRFLSIRSFAKRRGATVNDVVLAAYIRSLYAALGRTVAVPCTIDLRRYLPGRKAGAICNLSSQLICDVGPDIGEGLGETLVKVKQAMNAEKQRLGCLNAIALLEAIFGTLPYPLAKRFVSSVYVNPPIHMTNIGILDKERLSFGDAEATHAFATGSIKYNPYFQIALSSFDDEATFSVNFYGTEADRRKVRHFLWTLEGELPTAG